MDFLHNTFEKKPASLSAVLFFSVLLSGCLYLDIGTVLSLKRLDPYTVDLVNSRAAVLLPKGLVYEKTVGTTLRITRNNKVLQEEKFALEVLEDGEALPGIDVADLPRKPLIIRLGKADFERATRLQKKLSKLDKNHKWVEPGSETVSDEGAEHRKIAADERASGDLTIKWNFSLTQAGFEKYCTRHKRIKLTAWVKINDDPGYRRVVHGLPLKRLYGKKGMKKLCAMPPQTGLEATP